MYSVKNIMSWILVPLVCSFLSPEAKLITDEVAVQHNERPNSDSQILSLDDRLRKKKKKTKTFFVQSRKDGHKTERLNLLREFVLGDFSPLHKDSDQDNAMKSTLDKMSYDNQLKTKYNDKRLNGVRKSGKNKPDNLQPSSKFLKNKSNSDSSQSQNVLHGHLNSSEIFPGGRHYKDSVSENLQSLFGIENVSHSTHGRSRNRKIPITKVKNENKSADKKLDTKKRFRDLASKKGQRIRQSSTPRSEIGQTDDFNLAQQFPNFTKLEQPRNLHYPGLIKNVYHHHHQSRKHVYNDINSNSQSTTQHHKASVINARRPYIQNKLFSREQNENIWNDSKSNEFYDLESKTFPSKTLESTTKSTVPAENGTRKLLDKNENNLGKNENGPYVIEYEDLVTKTKLPVATDRFMRNEKVERTTPKKSDCVQNRKCTTKKSIKNIYRHNSLETRKGDAFAKETSQPSQIQKSRSHKHIKNHRITRNNGKNDQKYSADVLNEDSKANAKNNFEGLKLLTTPVKPVKKVGIKHKKNEDTLNNRMSWKFDDDGEYTDGDDYGDEINSFSDETDHDAMTAFTNNSQKQKGGNYKMDRKVENVGMKPGADNDYDSMNNDEIDSRDSGEMDTMDYDANGKNGKKKPQEESVKTIVDRNSLRKDKKLWVKTPVVLPSFGETNYDVSQQNKNNKTTPFTKGGKDSTLAMNNKSYPVREQNGANDVVRIFKYRKLTPLNRNRKNDDVKTFMPTPVAKIEQHVKINNHSERRTSINHPKQKQNGSLGNLNGNHTRNSTSLYVLEKILIEKLKNRVQPNVVDHGRIRKPIGPYNMSKLGKNAATNYTDTYLSNYTIGNHQKLVNLYNNTQSPNIKENYPPYSKKITHAHKNNLTKCWKSGDRKMPISTEETAPDLKSYQPVQDETSDTKREILEDSKIDPSLKSQKRFSYASTNENNSLAKSGINKKYIGVIKNQNPITNKKTPKETFVKSQNDIVNFILKGEMFHLNKTETAQTHGERTKKDNNNMHVTLKLKKKIKEKRKIKKKHLLKGKRFSSKSNHGFVNKIIIEQSIPDTGFDMYLIRVSPKIKISNFVASQVNGTKSTNKTLKDKPKYINKRKPANKHDQSQPHQVDHEVGSQISTVQKILDLPLKSVVKFFRTYIFGKANTGNMKLRDVGKKFNSFSLSRSLNHNKDSRIIEKTFMGRNKSKSNKLAKIFNRSKNPDENGFARSSLSKKPGNAFNGNSVQEDIKVFLSEKILEDNRNLYRRNLKKSLTPRNEFSSKYESIPRTWKKANYVSNAGASRQTHSNSPYYIPLNGKVDEHTVDKNNRNSSDKQSGSQKNYSSRVRTKSNTTLKEEYNETQISLRSIIRSIHDAPKQFLQNSHSSYSNNNQNSIDGQRQTYINEDTLMQGGRGSELSNDRNSIWSVWDSTNTGKYNEMYYGKESQIKEGRNNQQTTSSGVANTTSVSAQYTFHIRPGIERKQGITRRIYKSEGESRNSYKGIFGNVDEDLEKSCLNMGKEDFVDTCPNGWISYKQFCFLIADGESSWSQVPNICSRWSGKMAMPKSQDAVTFLLDVLASKKRFSTTYFVGLRKKDEKWEWIDDTPLSQGLPNDEYADFQSCAVLHQGSLRTMSCDLQAGYICELKKGVEASRVLAVGDSLTKGYYNAGNNFHPYGEKLEEFLNKDDHRCFVVEISGKIGEMSSNMVQRISNYLNTKQRIFNWVVILAGTNDLLLSSSPGDKIADQIIIMHEVAHVRGAKTIVVTIPEIYCERTTCTNVQEKRTLLNQRLRIYAQASGRTTYLSDVALRLSLHRLSLEDRKTFWESSGVHMKPKGYDKLAEIIFNDLMQSIESP